MKLAPFLILVLGLGIVAYGLWYRHVNPPRITGSGQVKISDSKTGRELVLETREVTSGAIKTQEVKLPNGTWIDCRGDCRETVRKEYLEFWDERRLNKN